MRDCSKRPGRLGEEVEGCIFVVADGLERLIHISARVGVVLYRHLHQQEPCDRGCENRVLTYRLPDETRPKNPGMLARHAWSTL